MKKKLFSMLILCVIGLQSVFAQNREVSGVVTSAEDGLSIPGVSVIVKGTTIGTSTNFDGEYTISVPVDGKILLFSFVGMKPIEMPINSSSINVVMESESIGVDEVMVVAFGTAKKESFTGSAGVVGAKKLEERTLSSVTQALEGSTTGVQVSAASGQPGSAPAIRIRGFGSLNGSSAPLYVVDGAQYEGSIADISPDDIQSMTILKDASSTALYGSRAANGVILITTKRGKKADGRVKISFKAVGGVVTQSIPYYETVGAKDYYELQFESYKNSLVYGKGMDLDAAAAKASAEIYSKLKYNPFDVANDQIVGVDGKINPNANVQSTDLNWYDPMEQTGYRQNYNLSASGGGDKHDFFFSLGYLDESGYVKKSNFERVNARMNVNATPKKWLKLGTNLSVTLSKQGLGSTSDSNTGYSNPFYFARYMGPIYPVYQLDPATGSYILDANGEKQYDLGGGYDNGINSRPSAANNGRHIIAELDYNYNQTKTNTISNRSYAEFSVIEGLKVSTNVGLDIQNYTDREFENAVVGDGAPTGRYNETRFTRTVLNWNQLINYNTTINEDHNIEVLLGHESFDRHYTNMYGMKTQLTVNGINEFANFVTPTSLTGYSSDKNTEGYFGRLKYNFKNKYYFEGSYRRDGSSVFDEDVRWGGFFSAGATWRMDQEDFIQNISWIDQLKLRASYGEVGNDNMNDYYASQALYTYNPNAGESGLIWSTIGNPLLTWESSNSYDVAVEYAVLDNRIKGSFEYYKKISEDLLYSQPLPTSLGLSSQPRNIASLYNEGFELGLGIAIIDKDNLSWDIDIQASTIKNEITEIPTPFINGSKRWAKGHSIYDYYLYDYAGVDVATGAALYYVLADNGKGENVRTYDENNEAITTDNQLNSEKGYTGDSSIPDVFGSVSNTVSYKNFQLGVMFTYSIGGKILDYNYASLMNEGEYGEALHVDAKKAWKKAGDITNIPRLENGNDHINPTSDRWLTDASYLSLKNVNLSYTFKQAAISNFGITDLKVFVSGENLFMLTKRKGMNPQQAFSGTTSNVYLPSRVVSFGVNVSF
ncbi:TonB-dependent receptor [Ancylomarina sp. 16SWW S1-10-2]|uniref:SusC/RagA family TonB-linked outer membrane protein n=1 Tax=Ancylomarina sp. 16SWW S1-10-2 TaxID=2499681 RepID=UPI0012AD2914|nr:TonB-dependent receptor [Ancylomarina sp. 16SWW S1-10-2]MRT91410.1 TonB-dependent receptor [Ancylomarina sp. 16SWW S1-10-2]